MGNIIESVVECESVYGMVLVIWLVGLAKKLEVLVKAFLMD